MVDVGIVVINMKKVDMRVLDHNVRNKSFEEVQLGYNDEEALREASRCLNCPNPQCVKGCPVGVRIPQFIEAIKNEDLKKAYDIIRESSSLPAVCSRVCPQEKQCQSKCVKGYKGDAISIGALERYVADHALKNNFDNVKTELRRYINIRIRIS